MTLLCIPATQPLIHSLSYAIYPCQSPSASSAPLPRRHTQHDPYIYFFLFLFFGRGDPLRMASECYTHVHAVHMPLHSTQPPFSPIHQQFQRIFFLFSPQESNDNTSKQ